MFVERELQRLAKVASAANDHRLAKEIAVDLGVVRDILSRLRAYEDRAMRSLLRERISGLPGGEVKAALRNITQRTFDEAK